MMGKLISALAWIAFLVPNHAVLAGEAYQPSGTADRDLRYVFAPHPYLNPQDLFLAYQPVVAYLGQKIPGLRFMVETSKDYVDFENKIRGRRFHLGLPNPYQTLLSLRHGYRVIAKMAPDSDFRGMMVARRATGLRSPRDLEGKTLCFPSPSAVAATMLPLLHLRERGLDVKGNTLKFVGSPFSAIMNAYTGDAVACGVSVRHWRNWSRANPDKARELETLWPTESLPNNAVIARDDVPAPLAREVAMALIGMDKDEALDQGQFRADQNHFEPADNATYLPMAAFLERYDRMIGLPEGLKPPLR